MKKIRIMGILNVTPDSFSDGGLFLDPKQAVERALKMAAEGADWIDIGGASSRPGSETVSPAEERRRVMPVIRALKKKTTVPLSIDTTHSQIASEAIEAGVCLINDISAGRADPEMLPLVACARVSICLMHMKGEPKTMQQNPSYQDVVAEVKFFLRERTEAALRAGITANKILIDPGIGFGKRVEDNVRLLHELSCFTDLGFGILVGASRKSFIGDLTGAAINERLPGSLATTALAVRGGAGFIRVHDVAATRQFLQVLYEV